MSQDIYSRYVEMKRNLRSHGNFPGQDKSVTVDFHQECLGTESLKGFSVFFPISGRKISL